MMRRLTASYLVLTAVLLAACSEPGLTQDQINELNYESTQMTEDYLDYQGDRGWEEWQVAKTQTAAARSGYDPGAIDCNDFTTHREAQNFYEDTGGPFYDPYWLDNDNDGIACEWLP